MTNYASCAAALEIFELCAYIIDFLHDSTRDLKSCAVVCRTFTFPSQFHLFQVINLLMGPYGDPRHLRRDAAARLVQILTEAPHLCRLVRTLHAPIDSAVLTHVENMRLPRLNSLGLIAGAATAGAPGFSLARELLSLPSIHTVTLRTKFPSYAALDLLFSRCTPCLSTLNIPYIDVDSDVIVSRPAAVGRRSHITNLVLLRGMAPRVASWFFDLRCPLELSRLQRVECCERAGPVLMLLRTAGTTIVDLSLCAEDITAAFPLTTFPALAKLRLLGSPTALLTAIMTLPVHACHLQAITLAANCDDYDTVGRTMLEVDIDALTPIDGVLASLCLPGLTRVTVAVVRRTRLAIAAAKGGADNVALMCSFGKMHALGVLVMQSDNGWGRDTG